MGEAGSNRRELKSCMHDAFAAMLAMICSSITLNVHVLSGSEISDRLLLPHTLNRTSDRQNNGICM